MTTNPLPRVLLADDDASTVHILSHMLKKWGFDVTVATTGAQALDCLLASDAPNLALLDWMMPEMSGVDVCRKIRARLQSQAVHLILMTSRDSTSDLIAAMQAGVDDYIIKPIDAEQLRAKILLAQRNLERLQALEWERVQNLQNATLVSLGSMASGMAHEINNPLAIVAGTAAQCLEHLAGGTVDPAFLQSKIKRVDMQIKRIVHIVNALLQFSSDSNVERRENRDLRDLVKEATEFVRERFAAGGVALSVIEASQPLVVSCQPRSLLHALVNLLNNSFEAVREQPGAWVRVSLEAAAAGQILLRVTDSGTGIESAVRERMMNPFFTTKDIGEGVGLGLSVASGVLRAHGGELIYNDASSNTEFVLRIPVVA